MKHALFFCLLLLSLRSKGQNKGNYSDGNLSVTKHQLKINNQVINYTATAGYMPIKDESDSLRAKLFFVAYTKDGEAEPGKRPILFAYNGGPGSASLWLHMGALGPKRVVMTEKGDAIKPPYQYVDNEYSWLDKTDIVFIDPMVTGYTRMAGKNPQSMFTGYENDLTLVGDFIRLYTTKYERWSSPKFIGGESYGTTRSAGLSGYLQNKYGLYLNGVILISSIMDFATARPDVGNDRPYPLMLPTFAATAWYHKKLGTNYPELKPLLKEVEAFAINEYATALLKGDALPQDEREKVVNKLSQYTGLSKTYINDNNLRFYVGGFNKELLRTEKKTVGRLDGRFTGYDFNEAGATYDYDPSYNNTIYGPYAMAANDYIRRILKYENDLVYEVLTGRPQPWPLAQDKYLNVAETLRDAMTKNPHMKVWIANGFYDMATPYFATQNTVDHMFLKKDIRANLTMTYYEAGHMMYIHQPSLQQLKKDFEKFFDSAD